MAMYKKHAQKRLLRIQLCFQQRSVLQNTKMLPVYHVHVQGTWSYMGEATASLMENLGAKRKRLFYRTEEKHSIFPNCLREEWSCTGIN
jgi:hypothetical protein